MKRYIFKAALAGLILVSASACKDELDLQSVDPKSSQNYEPMELLAKQYATLGLTGQVGPAGNSDISGDEGEIGFYRVIFNLQELCSDECIWAWQNDTDIPAITNISWNADSKRAYWAYQRLAYDITLFNSFLSENDSRTEGNWPQYIAEVRFLRALHYYYFLDLFHKAPFKDTYDPSTLPKEKAGVDLYNWLDEELTYLESSESGMAEIGEFCNSNNFGRADKGAVYALHARLALNSEIYTDGVISDLNDAVTYSNNVINSGKYALSKESKNGYSGYEQVFMGDNDYNSNAMKEIIFPIRQDGKKTEEYAGSTYLVSSMRIAGMPYSATTNYWSCNYARLGLLKFFFDDPQTQCPKANNAIESSDEADVIAADEKQGGSTASIVKAAGDDRAMFYGGVGGGIRSFTSKQITGFLCGLSIVKWQNRRSDNTTPSDNTFSDTDIPLFRLAEMYLTRAEANYRLGNTSDAINDINVLRDRANASEISSLSDNILIKEWGREFYMEGRRRSDLVRFGLFTSSKYLWDFKGGVATGSGVDSKFNVYPIPTSEIANNPNMTQNTGY